jgi:hypothetical protein
VTERSPTTRRQSVLRFLGWSAAVVAVLAVTGLVILGAYLTAPPPYEPTPFDSTRWKAARDWDYRKGDNVRRSMVQSLRGSHLLERKTRAEVEALLGPPEGADEKLADDSRVPPEVAAAAKQWDYEIGYAGLDFDFLAVYFDRKGRVGGVEVWQG